MRRGALVTLAVVSLVMIGPGHVAIAFGQEDVELGGRRIVGGEKTEIAEHPWQVALMISGAKGRSLCGGAIVARRWVLTAAHCFNETSRRQDIRVKSGATNYREGGGWDEIERVVVHEGYKLSTDEHDLALVRLRSPARGRVIPLPDASAPLRVGDPLEVTGWGATSEGGQSSTVLQKATVPYVDTRTCNVPAAYNGRIGAGMMCAGYRDGGIDSCQGDSGGPLVARRPDGTVLVGVVSFGEGCARRLRYGVYTRVTVYRSWIDAVIAADKP